MTDLDYAEADRIQFSAKAYFLVDALRALAPLCAKTLMKVSVMDDVVRIEACTQGLGGVIHLTAEDTEPGSFVLPAGYVEQVAKVFPPKDYSNGGLLTVSAQGHQLSFRDAFAKQLELNDIGYDRVDEPAHEVLVKLRDEYGTAGGEGPIVTDPDRVRVITSVSKLIFGDVILSQPDRKGSTFVTIGQSFSGYIREPGWHSGKDETGDATTVTVLPGQSDIFEELA